MPDKSRSRKSRVVIWAATACLTVGLVIFIMLLRREPVEIAPVAPPAPARAIPRETAPEPERVVDFDELQGDRESVTAALMEERMGKYGVETSLDGVVTENEDIVVGGNRVSMKDIIEEVRLQSGQIVETPLAPGDPSQTPMEFGIHVVQENDNIWNTHFRLLQEYFASRGVTLSPMADEPSREGYSSGIGKILKFSENMVHIYNLETRSLDTDLNLIQPRSKIVVYNMNQVFFLLEKVDTGKVGMIRFDGDTLWMPAES
ncbi:MAG: hypothetical protein KKA60_16220 [Proteobacteria bacterium]|nr:hypothetical protein [Pseudomonadota bacterium]